jgi:hypothetical protein
MGTTNVFERVLASLGKVLDSAKVNFLPSADVPKAGVLCTLPALLANGLLHHTKKYFQLPKGYYGIESIFVLLAFMALLRVKSIEKLRYQAPGEWGKFLGLDRIPEVRTLRKKIRILTDQGDPKGWSSSLSKDWLEENEIASSVLYIDGHVRVYYGDQTKLPRHYVSRERLCLHATVDYWVNAMDGKPFFFVNKEIDPGLIKVIEKDIITKLETLVPNPPSQTQLEADPYLHRFVIVFDREGYSPEFFLKMKQQRVACITYRKGSFENWPKEEFTQTEVISLSGEKTQMFLAERGTLLGNKIFVREIRRMSLNGHQTSVVSTDYTSNFKDIAISMFSRWSQENFFKYMMEHYNLDRLISYELEDVPADTRVVNPAYRSISSSIKKKAALLGRKRNEFGALILDREIEKKNVEKYQSRKADLSEEIHNLETEINLLKKDRKKTPTHLKFKDLQEQFPLYMQSF